MGPAVFVAAVPAAVLAAIAIPTAISTTAAAITILGALAACLAFIYRAVRRVEDGLGVDKHGRTLSDRMERVEHQLWPNGGTSLADAVHRTSDALAETRAEVRVTRELLSKIIETR